MATDATEKTLYAKCYVTITVTHLKAAANSVAEWYDAICDYNVPDAATLGREMFATYDIYCGLRNKREFFAMKNTGVFDHCIWVDRSMYLPPEAASSMSLEQWMADFTIDNNGTLSDMKFNLERLMRHLTS